jgi:OOP family OmpA-OmpF porin
VLNSSPHKWAANYKFGFGAEYDLNRFVCIRLEGERYRVDDAVGNKGDVDLYSAGLVFKFGRTEAAPPPPPPPVRKRISFSADSLFDFAKDTVKPAGKQALDVLAAELRGAQFDVITVTGYRRVDIEVVGSRLQPAPIN